MSGRRATMRGFTIAELLIVLVIIGILAILVMNTLGGAQKRARDAVRSDDIHTLVGQLISYNTVHNGVPKPQTYGESNANGYDLSSTGDWLPFLASNTSGKLPRDPINTGSGDPFATTGELTYFYTCFKKGDVGNPDANNDTARLGYRSENTGQIKSNDFTVEACN